MKRKISMVLALFLAFSLAGRAMATAPDATAYPNAAQIYVNGNKVEVGTYNIYDNNYIKLRDIAMMMNGTDKQFDIDWNETISRITITSGPAYAPEGGELAPVATVTKTAKPSDATLIINEVQRANTAFNIEDYNYFKLRDIAEALDFSTTWDGAKSIVYIDTSKGYTAPVVSKNSNMFPIPLSGSYDSYADLAKAHPAGAPGEAYVVGSNMDLYIWNVDTHQWQKAGSLKGPQGSSGGTYVAPSVPGTPGITDVSNKKSMAFPFEIFQYGGSGATITAGEDGNPEQLSSAMSYTTNYVGSTIAVPQGEWSNKISYVEEYTPASFIMPHDGTLKSVHAQIIATNFSFDKGVIMRPFICLATLDLKAKTLTILPKSTVYMEPLTDEPALQGTGYAKTIMNISVNDLNVEIPEGSAVVILLGARSENAGYSISANLEVNGTLYFE